VSKYKGAGCRAVASSMGYTGTTPAPAVTRPMTSGDADTDSDSSTYARAHGRPSRTSIRRFGGGEETTLPQVTSRSTNAHSVTPAFLAD
jgi:hypothetical protein